MVKEIVWTSHAEVELNNVLEYWERRLGNNKYCLKLLELIKNFEESLYIFPQLGRIHSQQKIRYVVIDKNYSIFYEVVEDKILIYQFWDNRRNPADLKF